MKQVTQTIKKHFTISPFKQQLYNYISQRVNVPHIAIIAILNVTPTVYQIVTKLLNLSFDPY